MQARALSPDLSRSPDHGAPSTSAPPFDDVDDGRHLFGWWARLSETWWQRAAGRQAVDESAQARLDALVAFARQRSPLYRDAYRHVPDGRVALEHLPVMTKRVLMARFDEWATDPQLRREDVQRFLTDRSHIGERYLGRYVVWKSSGTSGEPGIYVQDDDALAVYDALIGVQLTRGDLAARCLAGIVQQGGRAALVAATGDHFASIASWQRVCHAAPGLDARGFSILEPLDRLVPALNGFRPAYLASYPTMLTLLAAERSAQRLTVDPDLVWSGGEYLSPSCHAALERAFGCPVVDEYGTSECLSIAFGCNHGWLHVNADWVLLEPVDADLRPTPPGHASHSVLLTNLANRVQPVIRYDLGDAVLVHPGVCACGNALPAIRVHGRCDDVVSLQGTQGKTVRLLPMALTTVVEEEAGLHRFQVVRRAADCLALRIDPGELGTAPHAVFERAARALHAYLAAQGTRAVRVVFDADPPRRDAASGKLRQVIAASR